LDFHPINKRAIAMNGFGVLTGGAIESGTPSSGVRPRRKGRRRPAVVKPKETLLKSATPPDVHGLKTWPCTQCYKNSRNLYEWKRHEATHVTGAWICMPDNTPIVDDYCVFCGVHDPPVSHVREHLKLEVCIHHPLSERSFARKDKLNEHIQRIHLGQNTQSPQEGHSPSDSSLLDRWKREPTGREALWCGFCKIYCSNWTARQEHVGGHLQNMLDISLWESLS
jgi:hypothetical protein